METDAVLSFGQQSMWMKLCVLRLVSVFPNVAYATLQQLRDKVYSTILRRSARDVALELLSCCQCANHMITPGLLLTYSPQNVSPCLIINLSRFQSLLNYKYIRGLILQVSSINTFMDLPEDLASKARRNKELEVVTTLDVQKWFGEK